MNRIAAVDKELCNPAKCKHECMKACPVNRKGEDCVKILAACEIDEAKCIGCGFCAKKCAFQAINVVNLPESLKENPIHRFGKNDFALFRLPMPVKGVVGILGPNGVGKSTALKILAGKLEPNLGIFNNITEPKQTGATEIDARSASSRSGVRHCGEDNKSQKSKTVNIYEELIKIHRGTELQNYLEQLMKEKITVSYKPQSITNIRDIAAKHVYDFAIDSELKKTFEIENLENRKLEQLSGGELQRVAIAAAITKEADVYYFDEPTSYLDVRQRLNVAKAIRRLAEQKFVVVVEHDLATLDFLADTVHIFYGEPGVFGVVSKPYAVKRGINVFLDGYIQEDNVRIREPTIFAKTTVQEKKKKDVLVGFKNIKKEFPNFSLAIDGGEIYREEVLGIFGANGLGKTTFAKILAGELVSEGEISGKIKISFKPQYLSVGDFLGTVSDLLTADKELVKKLGLEKLMEKSVKNLSGGELQRLSLALCLSKDADLYLLDEPSAFLDVDQRLGVAKILQSLNKTVAVIDHDLLFLSYLADRAMLFSGESAKHGSAEFLSLRDGFNKFLKSLNISFRRDETTGRPRANKPGSVIDREQKDKGNYFVV